MGGVLEGVARLVQRQMSVHAHAQQQVIDAAPVPDLPLHGGALGVKVLGEGVEQADVLSPYVRLGKEIPLQKGRAAALHLGADAHPLVQADKAGVGEVQPMAEECLEHRQGGVPRRKAEHRVGFLGQQRGHRVGGVIGGQFRRVKNQFLHLGLIPPAAVRWGTSGPWAQKAG